MNTEYIEYRNSLIVKNPTNADYMTMKKEFVHKYPYMMNEPATRRTYDECGNEYLFTSDNIHASIEPFLFKMFGIRLNQNKDFDMFDYYYGVN
jgi:hypothetical protein